MLTTYKMAISEEDYYRVECELIAQQKRKNNTFIEIELVDCVIEMGEKKESSDVEFATRLCFVQIQYE